MQRRRVRGREPEYERDAQPPADDLLDVRLRRHDVRGVYPDQLDEAAARRIGAAFAEFTRAGRIVMGRDSRLSSPALSAAFAEGVTGRGPDVVDIGLATTDMLYFAS